MGKKNTVSYDLDGDILTIERTDKHSLGRMIRKLEGYNLPITEIIMDGLNITELHRAIRGAEERKAWN